MVETVTINSKTDANPAGRSFAWRLGLFALLAAIELPLLAFVYDPVSINGTDVAWERARVILREVVPFSVFFIAALAIVATPQRLALFQAWRNAVINVRWVHWLVANIAGFSAMLVATAAFNRYGAQLGDPPWMLFFLWVLGVGGVYLLLGLAIAPIHHWRDTIYRERWLIALAAGAAAFVESAAVMSRQSWNGLSEATFQVSAWLLQLYEKDVVVEPARRVLGIGEFKVNIAAACSGYEGIGLVTAFLAIYMWIFRSVLKFPNSYLIIPIGIAAIWTLNNVRIAALVSLGAHVSPEIAITGFHSQAGWMMFLIVTIGIMLATHRISYFHNRDAVIADAPPSPAFIAAIALLGPFLAMTAAGIVTAAFSAEDGGYWLYAVRVGAITLALIAGWRFYRKLDWRTGWEPLLIGLVVGAAWIATDPGRSSPSALGEWIGTLTPVMAAFWISLRLVGTIVLVPIAEELAFRGYIHRKLIADDFTKTPEDAFSWKALIISSALFALLHQRWLAGGLAGVAFAIALYRSGKVTGAIYAHMSANALIAIWAILVGQWSLL